MADSLNNLIFRVELPHFGAVTAALHVAPAAVVVFAGIEKEPLTLFRGAGADKRQLIGGKKIGGGASDLPKKNIEVVEVVKAPLESSIDRDQAQVFGRDAGVSIECGESCSRHGAMVDESPENIVDGFAQLFRAVEGFLREIGRLGAALDEAVGLDGIEQAGVFAEAGQIAVVLEQFFGLSMTVIERVDEIQRHVAGDQIEARRAPTGKSLVVAGLH